jgi:DNA mismatch repair protein MutS
MMQYQKVKDRYKNEVLFFRLGDFYEMFNDDAVEVSRLLNLTLTQRAGSPMCGIPYHAAKIYIARLLRLGKKIAICEQTGEIAHGKGLTKREVVEVITPGTAVESEYLEGSRNNFLASLFISRGKAGFAFIDVTTSSFSATSWPVSAMSENFPKELGRCSPRELLLPQSLHDDKDILTAVQQVPSLSVSYYPDWDFSAELSYNRLTAQFQTANLQSFSLSEDSPEVPPAGFLLDYLEKTTNTRIPHVSGIHVYRDSEYVILDESSRRNLEIVANMRDGSPQYSLLECVNYTMTSMGSRMLRSWLLSPLTDCRKISARQDHVALFFENTELLQSVRTGISPILDIERLAGRIAMDRAHAKDLQALRASLEAWLSVRKKILTYDFACSPEADALKIISIIRNAILDDPSTSLTEGGIIKDGWSKELDHLRQVRANFDKILEDYAEEEKQTTGIPNLKIRYNRSSGYYIEITKGKLSSVPSHFIMRRSLLNAERYTTEKLQDLEHELTTSGTKIIELERDLFVEIRSSLHNFVPYLLQTASEIAYTDVTASLAYAAGLHVWVRPVVDQSSVFCVTRGRHPVVELHLPTGEFVPNNLFIQADAADTPAGKRPADGVFDDAVPASFALITGPNMAGKSTYLRQNALIALLAQTGSFVPAESARIGIVDRIFCRVGASDNLARGESTFLVEMTETAHILRSATNSSLVIMDEVGRGTSTEDGLSIAWAVTEYLLEVIKCRTLFATHYHELTRIENPRLKLLCMDVSDAGGTITFLRKIKAGASEDSYGIHVARLAGIPQTVIDRANTILSHIQNVAADRPVITDAQTDPIPPARYGREPGLFTDEEMVLDELLSVDPDNMTPLAALQILARWKKTLSGK